LHYRLVKIGKILEDSANPMRGRRSFCTADELLDLKVEDCIIQEITLKLMALQMQLML